MSITHKAKAGPLLTGTEYEASDAHAVGNGSITNVMLATPAAGGSPAVVLGTAAAAGVATTFLRDDDTIVAFDATVPVTQAFGDSAATGSAAVASRRDHKHGIPTSPLGLPLALTGATAATRYVGGTAASPPSSGTFAVGDFVITAEGLIWVCTSAGTPGTWNTSTSPADLAFSPGGNSYESAPRRTGTQQTGTTVATGILYLVGCYIPAGYSVGHISFVCAGTAAVTPTHWWYGLYDSSRVQLAVTADQTSTAYGAFAKHTLAIATIASGASSTFVTTYSGLHYIGWMMTAATQAVNYSGGTVGGIIAGTAPIIAGTSDTAQTTPPAFPHTAGAISNDGAAQLYAYVSP